MINNYEVFVVGDEREGFDWVDRWINALDWDEAIQFASSLARTPWFWITSQPELVDPDELVSLHPRSLLFSQTKMYKVFYNNDYRNWSTLKLVHTKSSTWVSDLPWESWRAHGFLPKVTNDNKVFFVANGESNYKENWKRLLTVFPRAQQVRDVQGRWNMFQACADKADGQNFFIVTAKNYVNDGSIFYDTFDPLAKHHWVFQAQNPVNRLVYGHMGIVYYNYDLVCSTPKDFGLDFTMYSPVHSVYLTPSVAHFATSPYETWRTAFREAVKLTTYEEKDGEAGLRLHVWTSYTNNHDFGIWSLRGARDGREWATKNPNDLAWTVEWDNLAKFFKDKYPDV